MRPILFFVGSRPVYAYGLSLTVAFLVGAWIAARRAPARGLEAKHVYLTGAWAFLAAVLGSRILFLLTDDPAALVRPREWFRIGEGGLVFYGGFFAAVATSLLYSLYARIPFWSLADVIAPSIALGHGFVRVGCFLNGCCYGKPAPWGFVFPSLGDGIRRQPTQLYESATGVLLFLGLLAWEKRAQRVEGELVLAYAAAYGAARFLIEIARDDDRGARLAGLTISQVVGLVMLAAGSAWLVTRRARASVGAQR